nr:bZIP transcription factor 16-like [Ipomoea batatas]
MGSSERDKSPKEAKEPKTPSSQEQATTTGTVNPEWPGFQVELLLSMLCQQYHAASFVVTPYFIADSILSCATTWVPGIKSSSTPLYVGSSVLLDQKFLNLVKDNAYNHLMPPYGTPPHPYVAMYPHGSIYAHPSMPPGAYPFSPFPVPSPNGIAEASVNTSGNVEVNSKASEGKENAESASEGSSGGSDANSQNESQTKSGGEAPQNGNAAHGSQNGESNAHAMMNHAMGVVPITAGGTASGVPGPTTNLNIGMDYWGSAASSAIHGIQGKVPSAPVASGMVATGPREGVQPQLWVQVSSCPSTVDSFLAFMNALLLFPFLLLHSFPSEEGSGLGTTGSVCEIVLGGITIFSRHSILPGVLHNLTISFLMFRMRRSSRGREESSPTGESARRSRLRKQAECDELAQRAEALKEENASLRSEINRIKSDYEQLLAQNASLKEKLGEAAGKDDPRPSRNEHVGTQSSEAEPLQGGQ